MLTGTQWGGGALCETGQGAHVQSCCGRRDLNLLPRTHTLDMSPSKSPRDAGLEGFAANNEAQHTGSC